MSSKQVSFEVLNANVLWFGIKARQLDQEARSPLSQAEPAELTSVLGFCSDINTFPCRSPECSQEICAATASPRVIEDLRLRPKTTSANCILSLCHSSYVTVLVWSRLAVLISQVPLLLSSFHKQMVPHNRWAANSFTISVLSSICRSALHTMT